MKDEKEEIKPAPLGEQIRPGETMSRYSESVIKIENFTRQLNDRPSPTSELWKLSRKQMPDFDGMYYVYGFMHHSCGNVTPFHKIVECRNNQWLKSDVGEQMTYWRSLLLPPVIEDIEDEFHNQYNNGER